MASWKDYVNPTLVSMFENCWDIANGANDKKSVATALGLTGDLGYEIMLQIMEHDNEE